MSVDFRLPDLAEGVAEGEVIAWRVTEGDRVEEDDVIAEVETDKALVEVPSPYAGVVTELCATAGDVVPVGDVLARFEVAGEGAETVTDADTAVPGEESPAADVGEASATDATGDSQHRPVPAPPSVRRLAREAGVDIATVSGSGSGGRVTRGDVERAANEQVNGRADAGDGAAGGETGEPTESGEPAPGASVGPRERTLATPATRRVADETGVDIDRVPASEEREGEAYVTEADVRAVAERETRGQAQSTEEPTDADRQTTEATAAAVEAAAATLGERTRSSETAASGPDERTTPAPSASDVSGDRVPYRGVRRSIGERLVRSARTVPHATHHDSVDVRRLVEVREALNAETDASLSYTAFVVRAVVSGLAAYPALNARLDEAAEEIVYRDEYNVGVAVATDAGLLVPVVEDADELGLETLAERIATLAARARDRSLGVEELRDGTFTVSNVGVVGGEYATPIVNHPEVAVLALGAIRERPRVVDGEVVARPTLPLSLSIDHRVVDGAVAAAFTNHVRDHLREPARLLMETPGEPP
jgi:pyruvate dehydrogenase E2 component (dihydrolipoamide acetyltransferase)